MTDVVTVVVVVVVVGCVSVGVSVCSRTLPLPRRVSAQW